MNAPFLRRDASRHFGPIAAGQPAAPSEYTDLIHDLLQEPRVSQTLASVGLKFTALQNKVLRLHLLECSAHVVETPSPEAVSDALSAIELQLDAEIAETEAELAHWNRECAARDATLSATVMAAQDALKEATDAIAVLHRFIESAPNERNKREARLAAAGVKAEDLARPLEPTEATVNGWKAEVERLQSVTQQIHGFLADRPVWDKRKIDGIELKTFNLHHARLVAPVPSGPTNPHEFRCAFDQGVEVNHMQLVSTMGSGL